MDSRKIKQAIVEYNNLKLGERMSIIFIHGRHLLTESFKSIKVAVFVVKDFFVEVAYDTQSLNVINVNASADLGNADILLRNIPLDLKK